LWRAFQRGRILRAWASLWPDWAGWTFQNNAAGSAGAGIDGTDFCFPEMNRIAVRAVGGFNDMARTFDLDNKTQAAHPNK
jgi:hypothetical protein